MKIDDFNDFQFRISFIIETPQKLHHWNRYDETKQYHNKKEK